MLEQLFVNMKDYSYLTPHVNVAFTRTIGTHLQFKTIQFQGENTVEHFYDSQAGKAF